MTPEELEREIEVVAYHHPDGALQAAILKLAHAVAAEECEACAAVAAAIGRQLEAATEDTRIDRAGGEKPPWYFAHPEETCGGAAAAFAVEGRIRARKGVTP